MNLLHFLFLFFVAPYEKLDERKKITKLLKKTADVVEANAMQIQDVQKWIVARADEVHVHIDNAAVSLLLELVGSNVTMLAKEMDKLTLYVGMGGEITTKLVAELVPKSVEQNVFALTEKSGEKRYCRCNANFWMDYLRSRKSRLNCLRY